MEDPELYDADLDATERALIYSARRRAALAAFWSGVVALVVWLVVLAFIAWREGHIWGWWR